MRPELAMVLVLSFFIMHHKFMLCAHFYRPRRSYEGYVFIPVCLSTGGGLPQCMLGYHLPGSRHTPLEHTHPEQTPPHTSRRLLLQTVHILLQCILVCNVPLKYCNAPVYYKKGGRIMKIEKPPKFPENRNYY